MKRLGPYSGTALLLAALAVWAAAGREESMREHLALAAERPPIDRVQTAKLETATFALG